MIREQEIICHLKKQVRQTVDVDYVRGTFFRNTIILCYCKFEMFGLFSKI
jgi:hypothetical protein